MSRRENLDNSGLNSSLSAALVYKQSWASPFHPDRAQGDRSTVALTKVDRPAFLEEPASHTGPGQLRRRSRFLPLQVSQETRELVLHTVQVEVLALNKGGVRRHMQERQTGVRAEVREPLSCLPPSEAVWVVDDDDLIEVTPDRTNGFHRVVALRYFAADVHPHLLREVNDDIEPLVRVVVSLSLGPGQTVIGSGRRDDNVETRGLCIR